MCGAAELTLDRLDRFDSEQDYPTLLDVLELDRTDSHDYVKLEKWSSPGTSKVGCDTLRATVGQPVISREAVLTPLYPALPMRPSSQTPFNEAIRQKFQPVQKGEMSGPSWTNHWFKVTITVPKEWVAAKPDRIQFEFDPSKR
jgi:hypothetical protein